MSSNGPNAENLFKGQREGPWCGKYAHLHMEITFHILVWHLKQTMYQIKHIFRKIESL